MNVEQWIQEEKLIQRGDHIAVALSGGPDSMALLHWLLGAREAWQLTLTAIHIHHGLREASDAEATFVEAYCQSHDVPIDIHHVDLECKAYKGMSTEEKARAARYNIFKQHIEAHQCLVALAHHMNDQAETVLLNLLRGAGPQGLKGMMAKRGGYIRPLLTTKRSQIMAYCKANDVPYVTDASNESSEYTRNYLRNEILPVIEERVHPNVVERICTTAKILDEENTFLNRLANEAYRKMLISEKGSVCLDRTIFNEVDPVIGKRVLKIGLSEIMPGLRNVSYIHLSEAVTLIRDGETGKRLTLPEQCSIRLEYNRIFLEKEVADGNGIMDPILIDKRMLEDGRIHVLHGLCLCVKPSNAPESYPKNLCTKRLDYDKMKTDLSLRTRRPGDWLTIDRNGHRKKLKNFFIDKKVPRKNRDSTLLLAAGGEILWIVGDRINESYRISETTKLVLEVSFIEEDHQ